MGAPTPPSTTEQHGATADDRPLCEVRLQLTERDLVLRVRGALVASTMPALSAQFDQLQCTPCDEVVLDLHELRSIDTVGSNAILGITQYMSQRHSTLQIRGASREIEGLLISAGLAEYLPDGGASSGDGASRLGLRAAAVGPPPRTPA
jgi:anti-anti-sigma factor